jgi:hypothetical protein
MSHNQNYCYECGEETFNQMDTCNECRVKLATKQFKKNKKKRNDFKKRKY